MAFRRTAQEWLAAPRHVLPALPRDPRGDPIAAKGICEAIASIQSKGKPFVYNRHLLAAPNPAREKMAKRLEEIDVANVREPKG